MKASQVSLEHLVTDLKAVARDSEELLKTSVSDGRDAAGEIRNRIVRSLEAAKDTCERLQDKTVAAAKSADKTVRDHPYQTAGIAFGLGLLIGVLVTRKW